MDIKTKFLNFLYLSAYIGKLLLQFVMCQVLFYIVGIAISFEFNPLNWWLLNHSLGRILMLILELGVLRAVLEDEF